MKNTSLLEHLGYVAMIKICGGEKAIQEKYENKIVNTYKELEEISFEAMKAFFDAGNEIVIKDGCEESDSPVIELYDVNDPNDFQHWVSITFNCSSIEIHSA